MTDTQNTYLDFKKILSEHLGIEPEDIKDDDRLIEDLHIRPPELTDFLEKLSQKGFRTNDLELSDIETVMELFESLNHEIV